MPGGTPLSPPQSSSAPLPHIPTAHRSTPASHRQFSWCPAHPRSWRARSHLGDTQGGVRPMGATPWLGCSPSAQHPPIFRGASGDRSAYSRFSGFRSRCTTPFSCRYCRERRWGWGEEGMALAGQRKDVSRSEFPFLNLSVAMETPFPAGVAVTFPRQHSSGPAVMPPDPQRCPQLHGEGTWRRYRHRLQDLLDHVGCIPLTVEPPLHDPAGAQRSGCALTPHPQPHRGVLQPCSILTSLGAVSPTCQRALLPSPIPAPARSPRASRRSPSV